MKKRGIALLMVAAMMAGTLSGCSGGGSTGKAGAGAQTEAQTVAEVDPSLYEVTDGADHHQMVARAGGTVF